ncbi:hypothetical protein [Moraxella bovoculi]|uniref:hypothetical protein n=1 Tax=Moraxella bovoculi TaxID=386891 RepID=UPI00136382AE|nr:hypothetical protein [Moraxella bovoculi]
MLSQSVLAYSRVLATASASPTCPLSVKPCATLSKSPCSRFWLSLNLPIISLTSTVKPKMPCISSARQSAEACHELERAIRLSARLITQSLQILVKLACGYDFFSWHIIIWGWCRTP